MACVVKRRGKYVLDYRDQYGNRRWETTDGNKKEAETLLAQRLIEIGKGNYVAPKDRAVSFAEFSKQWLSTREGKIRPITLEQYQDHLALHLLPFFGPLKLTQIDIGSIDAYSAKKQRGAAELERRAAELQNQASADATKAAAEGREMSREEKAQHVRLCSESRALARQAIGIPTINKTITTLGSILKHAVRSKFIDSNPVHDVERPKVSAVAQAEGENANEDRDVQVIPKDQINAFWAATTPGLYRMLFSAALTTGMRSEELFALQWGDVDWQANQILVRRVLTRHKGGWRFYEPKTKTSKRRVDVDPSFLLELKKWKLQQAKSDFNDLIFTNGEGQPLHRSTVRKQGLLPTLRKAGLPLIHFHHLRHTYASLLIDQGENPKYIQAQMGHSSINVTMDIYGHLMEKVNTRSANRLAAAVFTPRAEQSGSILVAIAGGTDI